MAGKKKVSQSGFCYLRLFATYNNIQGNNVFDMTTVKDRFGRYPLIRMVVAHLYEFAVEDFYLPHVRLVHPNLYHVEHFGEPVLFSDLFAATMFSTARVGGKNDQPVKVSRAIANFSRLCETTGVDHRDTRDFTELHCTTQYLRIGYIPKTYSYKVKYRLSPSEIGSLQEAFPELNVMVTGKKYHPHAMSAASRDCCEALILKMVYYKRTHQPWPPKDVYLIDISANFVRHIRSQRFNIHCCVPTLGIRDSSRKTERIMQNMLRNGTISRKIFTDYVGDSPDRLHRCRVSTQDCDVTAEYGMLIHSQHDISLQNLLLSFDSHQFDIVWSVINFDVKIFYKESGIMTDQKIHFSKRNGKIYFTFLDNTSSTYVQDLDDYMRILTDQILITPKGRLYAIDRYNTRVGNLFLRYVYCSIKWLNYPCISQRIILPCGKESRNTVFISTWNYCDSYFSESKFAIKNQPTISFKRRFIGIGERFYALLYKHCFCSFGKSFNLNEIFSAALTSNTKMTIDGNDIRAINGVASTDLMAVVVATYCIAYRDWCPRFKKFARCFGVVETHRAKTGVVGFSDLIQYLIISLSAHENIWSDIHEKLLSICVQTDLNASFFNSVRCVELDEFMQTYGDYGNDCEVVKAIDVDFVTVEMVDGYISKVVDYSRKKFIGVKCGTTRVEFVSNVELVFESDWNISEIKKIVADRNTVITTRAEKKRTLLRFHILNATKLPESAEQLSRGRKEDPIVRCAITDLIKMPRDGHCLLWALGYHFGLDAISVRNLILANCTESEKRDMKYLNISDGSFDGHGRTDCVRIFSKVMEVNICIHVKMDGKSFVTVAYSSAKSYSKTIHLQWIVNGVSGHVDILNDVNQQFELRQKE